MLQMGGSRVCVHGAQKGGFRAASEAAAAEIGLCCPLQWKNYLTVTAALSADIMGLDRKIQGRKLLDVHCLTCMCWPLCFTSSCACVIVFSSSRLCPSVNQKPLYRESPSAYPSLKISTVHIVALLRVTSSRNDCEVRIMTS